MVLKVKVEVLPVMIPQEGWMGIYVNYRQFFLLGAGVVVLLCRKMALFTKVSM